MPAKEQTISPLTFEALLQWLNADREQAGSIFEQLRTKLIRFFIIQHAQYPEECADDTLQRAADKIAAGVIVQATDPYTYLRGIARNVLHEAWKAQQRAPASIDDLPVNAQPIANADDNNETEQQLLLDRLSHCLQQLPAENRELFLAYHHSESESEVKRMAVRNQLAAQLNIDISALRNRITRLRLKLEQCMRNFLTGRAQ